MLDNESALWVEKANKLLNSGQLLEAKAIYEKVCSQHEDATSFLTLGSICGELGNLGEAIYHARKAVALDPDYADAHHVLGVLLRTSGDTHAALHHFQLAVKHDPEFLEPLLELSAIYGAQNNHEQAAACCRRIIELSPDYTDAYMNLANALIQSGNLDEAIVHYSSVVSLRPGQDVAWFMLAQTYAKLGKYDLAEDHCLKAIALAPSNSEAYLLLGRLKQKGNDLAGAEDCFQSALKISPNLPEAHVQLGITAFLQDKIDMAIGNLRQALHLDPGQPHVFFNLAVFLEKQNRFDEAEECYLQAVKLKPDYCQAFANLGLLQKEKGRLEQAAKNFEQVLLLKPDDVQAAFLLSALRTSEAPKTAPAEYVARLFDDCADRFDGHLVGKLEYRTPHHLNDAIRLAVGERSGLSIMDLGCGTGLCGPLLRDIAKHLVGVDLSPKMIEKARERNVYHALEVSNITDALASTPKQYDVILAADVFVYIGDLGPVFEVCKHALREKGIFAFSIEASDVADRSYVLRNTGRYAHSLGYIRDLTTSFELAEISLEHTILRKEKGMPVEGYVFVLAVC